MLRLLAPLVALLLVPIFAGCSGPKDQSEARLKEMPYTFENVEAEVVNRYTAIMRGPRRSEGGESVVDEGRENDGPGGNPFTLENLAEDTLGKLKRVEAIPLPELLTEFQRRLSASDKLKPTEVEEIMAALHAAAGDSTSSPSK